MKKRIIISLTMCLFTLALLTGCGKKNQNLFHIDSQDLSYGQAKTFGYIYTMEYNITDSSMFQEVYEDGMTYEAYYKQQIKDDIVDTMLLYNEAKSEKISLSSEEKKDYKQKASEFEQYYGEDYLQAQDITTKDIQLVYEMKAFAGKYLNSLSETSDAKEEEQYVKVEQVLFSTAKLDEDGNYVMDEEGNIEMLSDSECADIKEKAEEFSKKAQDGEDMEALAKQMDSSVTCAEKYLKYKDLPKEYKDSINAMSVGNVSDPISFRYGYYVVKLLEKDGKDYAKALSDHDKANISEENKNRELERLYRSHIGNSTDYVEKEWDSFEISDFMK